MRPSSLTHGKNLTQAQGSDDSSVPDANSPAPLTKEQKKILFISAAVPMVGFGFMDNMVMITMGEVNSRVSPRICLSVCLSVSVYGCLRSSVSSSVRVHRC